MVLTFSYIEHFYGWFLWHLKFNMWLEPDNQLIISLGAQTSPGVWSVELERKGIQKDSTAGDFKPCTVPVRAAAPGFELASGRGAQDYYPWLHLHWQVVMT